MGVSYSARRNRAACISLVSLTCIAGLAPAAAYAAEIFGPPTNTAQNAVFGEVVNPNAGGVHNFTSTVATPAVASVIVLGNPATPFSNPFATFGRGESHPQGSPGAPSDTGLSV